MIAITRSILLFASAEEKAGANPIKSAAAPEIILGVSVDFPSTDILSITIDEARKRSHPVVDALMSPDATKRQAAMQLLAFCFQSRMSPKLSKYNMMEAALRAWANNASNPPGLKADRDAFVSAVNSLIGMYDGENREAVALALVLFVDLELQIDKADNAESLLRKWKSSKLYNQLIVR